MPQDYYQSTATRVLLGSTHGEPKGVPIYDDSTSNDVFFPKGMATGHDPSQYVPDMMAAPLGMKTYDPGDYDALYDEAESKQNSLEHVYLRGNWENLDQNGDGYCWSYSVGHANMLRRVALHMPFVRLNPHSVAAIIKRGRDEGGWCGLSLQFERENGCAVEGTGPGQWPLHSRSLKYDTPECRAEMKKYQVTDDWYDLGKPAYAQELKDAQHRTCLFNNCPTPSDFNWWGHSVCAVRWVRISANEWGLMILNSWKGWGRRGLAVLRGSKARNDGAVSIVNSLAA